MQAAEVRCEHPVIQGQHADEDQRGGGAISHHVRGQTQAIRPHEDLPPFVFRRAAFQEAVDPVLQAVAGVLLSLHERQGNRFERSLAFEIPHERLGRRTGWREALERQGLAVAALPLRDRDIGRHRLADRGEDLGPIRLVPAGQRLAQRLQPVPQTRDFLVQEFLLGDQGGRRVEFLRQPGLLDSALHGAVVRASSPAVAKMPRKRMMPTSAVTSTCRESDRASATVARQQIDLQVVPRRFQQPQGGPHRRHRHPLILRRVRAGPGLPGIHDRERLQARLRQKQRRHLAGRMHAIMDNHGGLPVAAGLGGSRLAITSHRLQLFRQPRTEQGGCLGLVGKTPDPDEVQRAPEK